MYQINDFKQKQLSNVNRLSFSKAIPPKPEAMPTKDGVHTFVAVHDNFMHYS